MVVVEMASVDDGVDDAGVVACVMGGDDTVCADTFERESIATTKSHEMTSGNFGFRARRDDRRKGPGDGGGTG